MCTSLTCLECIVVDVPNDMQFLNDTAYCKHIYFRKLRGIQVFAKRNQRENVYQDMLYIILAKSSHAILKKMFMRTKTGKNSCVKMWITVFHCQTMHY